VEGQQDELGSFIFRTTGYNSVRTLAARLKYYEAASGGNTKHLPLLLRLRAKSTTQSHRTPVYYVDLTLRDGQTLAEGTARKLAMSNWKPASTPPNWSKPPGCCCRTVSSRIPRRKYRSCWRVLSGSGRCWQEGEEKAVSRPTRLTSKLGAVRTA
jgi:hypothetical protein